MTTIILKKNKYPYDLKYLSANACSFNLGRFMDTIVFENISGIFKSLNFKSYLKF